MAAFFRRALAVLLCLCMLMPTLAFAEQDATGLRFDLRMSMDASAFPREQQKFLSGVADLLNILSIRGTLDQSFTGAFDMNAVLSLNDLEETRTSLRLYGIRSLWDVESSLLGQERLMINMSALLEFSLKAYLHLNLPLQRVTMLLFPYVHSNAFDGLLRAWRDVMLVKPKRSRTITQDDALALAQQLADIAGEDRAFYYWVKGLALESGYDETIMEIISMLPEWAETFVDKTGIQVTIKKDGTETWETGKVTLFTRIRQENMTTWSATPPAFPGGYTFAASYSGQPNGEHLLNVSIADEEGLHLLDATVLANNIPDLTSEVPISAPFSLAVDATGELLAQELHFRFEGEGEGNHFTLRMLSPENNLTQLTLWGTLEPYTPAVTPKYTRAELREAVNLLSVNEASLSDLMGKIAAPMLKGVFPLLLNMPASSMQSMMDLLTDSGLLALLAGTASTDYEEYFYEE